jgi:hypothetical protein
VLLCVSDDGGIYPYSVDGELLPWQLSLGAECAAQRVAEALVTPTSVVALTREAQLFVVRAVGAVAWRDCVLTCTTQATNLSEPRVERLAEVPQLEAFPHTFAGACGAAAPRSSWRVSRRSRACSVAAAKQRAG